MTTARFLDRCHRVVALIAIATWVFGAGCGSSGTKTPDAAGGDAAPDAAGADVAPDAAADVPADGAPKDVGGDTGASDVAGPPDSGGADGTDGGDGASDRCNPPCLAKLYGGCLPGGTCMKQSLSSCYSNGVKVVNTAPGSSNILLTIYKNGVECATLEPGFTYKDASGKVLGTITIESNGDQTLTCTGEPSETLPADCPLIPCDSGTCN